MTEEMQYFFAALDFHLGEGASPANALLRATEDYAAVYHAPVMEGMTYLQLAAEVTLRRLEEYREMRRGIHRGEG